MGQIVCSQHGGCPPGECAHLHREAPKAAADTRCGPCRVGEHEWCEADEVAGRMNRCCCGIATRGLARTGEPGG